MLRATTETGLVLTAHEIQQKHFRFSIALQSDPGGERVGSAGNDRAAIMAVNGGFFATTEEGNLSPVGYLRINGERLSTGWRNAGGFISFNDGRISLSPVAAGIPKGRVDVLQSKPMMIEPGGIWAMRTNQGKLKRRMLLCTKDDGVVVLIIISRVGMSLYEAGWLMREREVGGYFDCDSALALDGGRSTQAYFEGRPDLSLSGFTPVQNFLVVNRRGE